jgi:hypothetical protein
MEHISTRLQQIEKRLQAQRSANTSFISVLAARTRSLPITLISYIFYRQSLSHFADLPTSLSTVTKSRSRAEAAYRPILLLGVLLGVLDSQSRITKPDPSST